VAKGMELPLTEKDIEEGMVEGKLGLGYGIY
jgi:hypothetical protein